VSAGPEGPSIRELRGVRRDRVTLTQSSFEAIEQAIEQGTYPAGSRLPSEAELAKQLNVSRPTLREALRLLEERGLIVRRHGRGTFVRERLITKELNRNFGITTMIRGAGYTPGERGTKVAQVEADADVAEALELEVGDAVLRIERVRLASERPVVFTIDYLPGALAELGDLDEILSGDEHSLYSLLNKLHGIVIDRGQAQLIPCKASAELRALLETKGGSPLLCIKQVDFDQRDRPVMYSVEYHVADWVLFSVERFGPGSATNDL
jgi:GntR family transcriptional regulator